VQIPTDIPLLDLKAGTEDVQRFFYWNDPKYASRHTPQEVESWFKQHRLEVETINIIPSGIAVLGRLPSVHS
jgi:hypothetical protein